VSGFDRAARRRAARQRRHGAYPPEGAESAVIEGAVFVNDRDLGPGVFGIQVVEDPCGVMLSFANGPGKGDDLVELMFTADAAIAIASAFAEVGLHHRSAARRQKAAMN
jgi:hypothetical protein